MVIVAPESRRYPILYATLPKWMLVARCRVASRAEPERSERCRLAQIVRTYIDNQSYHSVMPNYLLRDVDDDTWRRAKARAALEGRSLRDVLVEYLRLYGSQPAKPTKRRAPKKT